MKKTKDPTPPGNKKTERKIRVEFVHPTASVVAIAGTFNDWRPEVTPMVNLGAGRWCKDLVLLPGRYEYRLVVDGEWMADPLRQETSPNPFGGLNSVVKVGD